MHPCLDKFSVSVLALLPHAWKHPSYHCEVYFSFLAILEKNLKEFVYVPNKHYRTGEPTVVRNRNSSCRCTSVLDLIKLTANSWWNEPLEVCAWLMYMCVYHAICVLIQHCSEMSPLKRAQPQPARLCRTSRAEPVNPSSPSFPAPCVWTTANSSLRWRLARSFSSRCLWAARSRSASLSLSLFFFLWGFSDAYRVSSTQRFAAPLSAAVLFEPAWAPLQPANLASPPYFPAGDSETSQCGW